MSDQTEELRGMLANELTDPLADRLYLRGLKDSYADDPLFENAQGPVNRRLNEQIATGKIKGNDARAIGRFYQTEMDRELRDLRGSKYGHAFRDVDNKTISYFESRKADERRRHGVE